MLVQQRSNSVHYFTTTAVANRNVDKRSIDTCSGFLRFLQHTRSVIREQVQGTHRMQSPPSLTHEAGDRFLDDREQRLQLWFWPGQVVRGQQPQRDHLDVRVIAPAKEVDDLGSPGGMTGRGGRTLRCRPPPIPIEDDSDVLRGPARREGVFQLRIQTPLVRAIDEIGHAHPGSFPRPA